MKRAFPLLLMASGLVQVCLGGTHSDRWSVREEETIQKTLTLSGEPQRVVIDNIDGFVHVTGWDGNQVRVSAHKLIRAESDTDVAEAKKEVTLEMTEKPGSVSVYYDAPWRTHGEGHRFYSVTYDIDVQVPRAAHLYVSTVNNGDLRVDSTTGDFEVKGINGSIRMINIAGSGEAHTINGPVTVSFAHNPRRPCSFKSINGTLDVYFKPGLSADLSFKTFNASVYTDFDVTARGTPASTQVERQDGKYVYRSNHRQGARAGQGGPELSFETLNGSVRLHEKPQGDSNHE